MTLNLGGWSSNWTEKLYQRVYVLSSFLQRYTFGAIVCFPAPQKFKCRRVCNMITSKVYLLYMG